MSGFTVTPNLGLFKPNYNQDKEQWGYHLNRNSDVLDELLGDFNPGPYLPLAGGDVVGPVTITQPGGAGTPSAFVITRWSAANASETVNQFDYYIANNGEGTTANTFNVNLHLRNFIHNNDAGGSTNGQTIVLLSELYSFAGVGPDQFVDVGSMHINHWVTSYRQADPHFIPTVVKPYGAMWGTLWNLIDETNLPSSLGGPMLNELDFSANNLDDAGGRSALVIIQSTRLAPGIGVVPCEASHAIGIGGEFGSGATQGTYITTLGISGNYSVAAIDLRMARQLTTVVRATLAIPSITVAVESVLPFTKAGPDVSPVSVGNPLSVTIGNGLYLCTGYALSGFAAQGTITLTTPVSVADGTAGNAVSRLRTAALWLHMGDTINWDDFGNYTTGYDTGFGALFFEGANWRFGTRNQQIAINPVSISAKASAGIANLILTSQGGGAVQIGSDVYGSGLQILAEGPVANLITVRSGSTGNPPEIQVGGSDTNIDFNFSLKGTGVFAVTGTGGMKVGGNFNLPILPTSPAGLVHGDVWRNGTVLNIV